MSTPFIPTRDADLVNWSNNFSSKINLSPTVYSLTAAQATNYKTLNDAWLLAYNAAIDPATRSPVNITQKDQARLSLVSNARALSRIIQGAPGVTPAQKQDLGLNPRDTQPSPIPPPATAPVIDILSVSGNTVRIRLHDDLNPTRRGKPVGVDGAGVYSFIGATPPADQAQWTFQGMVSRVNKIDVAFPSATVAGSIVWFTAWWFNERKQIGPAAAKVSTNLPGGSAMAA